MSESAIVERDHHAEVVAVAGHLNVANAQLVALAESLLATGGWEVGGMKSPAQYLVWKAGLSPNRAKTVVQVAERRAEFPTVMGSFDRGELSLEQVAEAIKAPAWADAAIDHFCHIANVPKLRRAMRSNMFTGDPDQSEPEPPPVRDRVSFGIGRDGRWRLSANLGVDDGRRIEAALAERRDALFTDGNEHVTTPEAFVDCFDRSLGSVASQSRRDHYRTWLHLDVTNGAATTTDGWRIPLAIADHLLCDGVVQPVWESDGVPFSVGRTQRIVPGRTRRIVERRDRGCRVPGCDSSSFVEVHHIVHWRDGGPTDTWNLISLCPRHHRLHHQGRLGISGDADTFDGIVFSDAGGRVIDPRPEPVTPTGPPPSPASEYRPPLNGRFDWNWIGLGWVHPNELARRRRRSREQTPERDAA